MRRNIYEIRFDGSWLGGKAIVKAIDEKAAWSALQKEWRSLEPLDKCKVKKLPNGDGVLYFDSGEY
jgi:hypothetical protein